MFDRSRYFMGLIKRHWLTVAFILGFITDLVLLNKVDDLIDNLILLFYVLLSTTAMFLLYVGVAERGPTSFNKFLKHYSPILMQYAFGGLLSGMLIFYGRSGDWLASAPFFFLILFVILGNEFVGKRSNRLVYNLALYFTGLFSYIVLVVPVVIGRMGDLIFILSGFLAMVIVFFVIKILYAIIPNFMEQNIKRVIVTIGGVYIVFNSLYFTNVIPPIPLSLIELEIAHEVSRTKEGSYRLVSEDQPWYRSLPFTKPKLNSNGENLACFARVFAPTRLSTEIFHKWEYKDESGKWQEYFRFGYGIEGSNEGGYGGYTNLTNFFSGVWRCTVETERGQVLSREVVLVEIGGEPRDREIRFE